MGGGASKRKKLAAEEEAARAEKANAKARQSEEEQLRAYQDSLSLQRDKDTQAQAQAQRESESEAVREKSKRGSVCGTGTGTGSGSAAEGHDSKDDGNSIKSAIENMKGENSSRSVQLLSKSKNTSSGDQADNIPPVVIMNPHMFEEFSEVFKARFVEEHHLGRPVEVPHSDYIRYKRVKKVKIQSSKGKGEGNEDELAVKKFDIAVYPWLGELGATFEPTNKDNEATNNTEGRDGFLVDARGKSIVNIREINKSHLDSTCLALDLSLNRFDEIHFKNVLTNLLYLNISGNLIITLDGIHCCKTLKVSARMLAEYLQC